MFKIQPTVEGICGTCRHAHIIEQRSRTTVICSANASLHVREPVVRCNEHDNKNQPSRWDYEKIAWVLNTDASGKKIGFSPPEKKPYEVP